MAFAVIEPARLPLDPPEQTDPLDDAYSGFTHVADRAVAHALLRTQPLDHARGHHYRGPRRLPGPDSHRPAASNLSLYVMWSSLSSWRQSSLGALDRSGSVASVLPAQLVELMGKDAR